MRPGVREFRDASLTVALCQAVPEHMRDRVRELSRVFVKPESRRQKQATILMNFVCQEADANGITLVLTVRDYDEGGPEDVEIDAPLSDDTPLNGRPNERQLVAWYKKFGFIVLQDTPLGAFMARQVVEKPRIVSVKRAVHEALH